MKILHVEAGRHLYGGAKQVEYLIKGLSVQGVRNRLLCPANSPLASQITCEGVTPIIMKGDLDIGLFNRIRAQILNWQPDLVHIHSRRGADIWGMLAARRSGIPVICTRRVDNPEPAWWAKTKYAGYQKVIAISEAIYSVLSEEGVADSRLELIHSVVDPRDFTHPRDRAWFNREFGLEDDTFVIGNFSQMIERKGQHNLILTINNLYRRFSNIRILCFGQGPKLPAYKELVAELNLEKVVLFPGFRNDVPRLLPNIDLMVHPALAEGLGVILLQASACGVPIIASQVGGIPDLVKHDHNGFLVTPNDIQALTDAIVRMLTDEQLRTRLAHHGKQRVTHHFTPNAMTEKYLSLYTQLIKAPQTEAFS